MACGLPLKMLDGFLHVRVQTGVAHEVFAVVVTKPPYRQQNFLLGGIFKCLSHEHDHAFAHASAHVFLAEYAFAEFFQSEIDRMGDIGQGIDEGAVEIVNKQGDILQWKTFSCGWGAEFCFRTAAQPAKGCVSAPPLTGRTDSRSIYYSARLDV